MVCDRSGVVVRASESATRLCGKSPLGLDFESVFAIPLPAGATARRGDRRGLRRQARATMLMSARPLVGREGAVGTVVTLTNISERKRAEEAERHAREAAENANRSKDEFLAMLAHELRNPLFAVRNAIRWRRRATHIASRRWPSPRVRPTSSRAWSTTCSTWRASRAARSSCGVRPWSSAARWSARSTRSAS